MKIVVIIPTYNEKEVIGRLIDALEDEFKKIPNHKFNILIVDGNSPDRTAEVAREKNRIYQNIDVITEKAKRGLGAAYVTGIKYAIQNLGAEAFVEFDGDFQHDPKDIGRLAAEFDKGYDYVIGSRYIEGGRIPEGWAFYRKFLSRFGSLFAKVVLNLPTNDNTSGFKLSRVKGFAENLSLDESELLSKYYAYKIQFLYEMIKMGAKTKEVPIKFLERKDGSSKSTFRDVFDSLFVVLSLRFKRNKKNSYGRI